MPTDGANYQAASRLGHYCARQAVRYPLATAGSVAGNERSIAAAGNHPLAHLLSAICYLPCNDHLQSINCVQISCDGDQQSETMSSREGLTPAGRIISCHTLPHHICLISSAYQALDQYELTGIGAMNE